MLFRSSLVLSNPSGQNGATATLAAAAPGGTTVLGQTVYGTATLTILDDESNPGTLGFEFAAYSVNEGDSGTVTQDLKVQRSGGSAGVVTVNYSVSGGTATGGGVDYTLLGSGTLTFANGEFEKIVQVQVVGDTLVDGEAILLRLAEAQWARVAPVAEVAGPVAESLGTAVIDVDLAEGPKGPIVVALSAEGTVRVETTSSRLFSIAAKARDSSVHGRTSAPFSSLRLRQPARPACSTLVLNVPVG